MLSFQTIRFVTYICLLTTTFFLSACGNDVPKEIAPRLVKVVIIGQDTSALINSQNTEATKNASELSFDASGMVIEVLVQQGSKVISGQALGRLMPSSMSMSESSALTSYRAARAEITSAEADFKRYTELRLKNFISLSEFEKRLATVETSRARFEQTMEQLGFVTLRALESGFVTQVSFQMNQQIAAQQIVVHVKVASQTHLKTDKTAKSNLTLIKNKSAAISIPSESIHSDGVSVFRVKLNEGSTELGTLELIKITISSVDESRALVIEGLTQGDMVVAAGWHALTAGQKVRVALIAKAP